MNAWEWNPPRDFGIWRHGLPLLRPLIACSPFMSVALLLMMFYLSADCLTLASGVVFDLPASTLGENDETDLVVLIMPRGEGTLVFFDDSRYMLDDSSSCAALASELARAASVRRKSMLVLADRHVASGELMRFAELARANGITRLLMAEKRSGSEQE